MISCSRTFNPTPVNLDGDDAFGSSWQLSVFVTEKKRLAPGGVANDQFGFVALEGDTLIVGALRANTGTGAVYIYEQNQGGIDAWGFVKKIAPLDSQATSGFGSSVDISGDVLVVGAKEHDNAKGFDAVAMYIFTRNKGGANNWGQVRRRIASDGGDNNNFGSSVAIDGDTVVVGARGDDSAYIFERNQGEPISGVRSKRSLLQIVGSEPRLG